MNSKLAEQNMMSKAFSIDPPSLKSESTMKTSMLGKKMSHSVGKMVSFKSPDTAERTNDQMQERIASIQNQAYDGAETNEEMYSKIKEINQNTDEIAKRIPMLFGKEQDEMRQIVHFILRYYDPILSLLEKQHL